MIDNIWKISIIILLLYIIYNIHSIKSSIKTNDKHIIQTYYKNMNDDNISEICSIDKQSIELEDELEINSLSINSLNENSDDFENLELNNLQNKNVKDLRIIAKKLNIPIHNKKKNDIINEILNYK